MARAVARYRQLLCHSCTRSWGQVVWGYDENWTQPRDPITCTCSTPHIEILPDARQSGKYAQARAEQRAVVYLMPDGSCSVPASNKYDDEIALSAVSGGGVRHEFPSVRSMQQFQLSRRKSDQDEFTDRCMVIDHNEQTILNHDTILHDGLKEEDRQRQVLLDLRDRGQVYFGGDHYERVRADYERSGRRNDH